MGRFGDSSLEFLFLTAYITTTWIVNTTGDSVGFGNREAPSRKKNKINKKPRQKKKPKSCPNADPKP